MDRALVIELRQTDNTIHMHIAKKVDSLKFLILPQTSVVNKTS